MNTNPFHETYVTVENGTPYEMEITTAIENDQDWASEDNRPDKNLNAANQKPLKLERFAAVRLEEDISSTATTANFKMAIRIKYTEKKDDKVEDKIDEITLSVNQYEARSRPALAQPAPSDEEPDEYSIPNSKAYKLEGAGADKYEAIQYFPENREGKLEHAFSIFEKLEVH